jgi:hypothetical protein
MAATDSIHDAVKAALVKEGWTITDDPYTINFQGVRVFADVGAERTLAAERAGRKLVVEAKSFRGQSLVRDFEQALGQYLLYRAFLEELDAGRVLYLAVSEPVYQNQEVVQWTTWPAIGS